jgi:hypothetical protein
MIKEENAVRMGTEWLNSATAGSGPSLNIRRGL